MVCTVHTECMQWAGGGAPAELLYDLTSSAPCCATLLTCEQKERHGLCAKAGGIATGWHASSGLHTGSQAGTQAPDTGLQAHF